MCHTIADNEDVLIPWQPFIIEGLAKLGKNKYVSEVFLLTPLRTTDNSLYLLKGGYKSPNVGYK